MDSIRLLKGYASKLEASQKALSALERRCKTLADKQDRVEQQRTELEAQIEATEQTLTELRAEDEDLKPKLLEAMMKDDSVKQRELKQRRKAVADGLRDGESEIEQLTASLEQLPDLDREAAALAVELDRLGTSDWYGFVEEMRKSLRSNAATLNSKRSEARKTLPAFDSATYEAIRLEEDEEYRKAKEFQEWQGNQLQERIERNRRELKIAANTRRVGWSGYVDQWGEKLPRGAVDADGTVKDAYQNEDKTRRAVVPNRTVTVVGR